MLAKSASRGKIFANEPNLLRVVAWGFWIPTGHYYQQMWIKCFSWVFLTFRWFWVCWTDAIFCRGQTHLSNFYIRQNLLNVLWENFHEIFVHMHLFLLPCVLPQNQEFFHYSWICFASLLSERQRVWEHLFKHSMHFDINKNSKKIE